MTRWIVGGISDQAVQWTGSGGVWFAVSAVGSNGPHLAVCLDDVPGGRLIISG